MSSLVPDADVFDRFFREAADYLPPSHRRQKTEIILRLAAQLWNAVVREAEAPEALTQILDSARRDPTFFSWCLEVEALKRMKYSEQSWLVRIEVEDRQGRLLVTVKTAPYAAPGPA
ncbi:MAG: hypothetical protein RL095_2424 [Verrucomicrobiota bacterium]|jgi:hypothetical protein